MNLYHHSHIRLGYWKGAAKPLDFRYCVSAACYFVYNLWEFVFFSFILQLIPSFEVCVTMETTTELVYS